jgi:hypothetical protein
MRASTASPKAVAWLRTKAVQRYPNTDFARKYKQG